MGGRHVSRGVGSWGRAGRMLAGAGAQQQAALRPATTLSHFGRIVAHLHGLPATDGLLCRHAKDAKRDGEHWGAALPLILELRPVTEANGNSSLLRLSQTPQVTHPGEPAQRCRWTQS